LNDDMQRTRQQAISFSTSDGYALAGTVFAPAEEARACVIINSAVAVRRAYYQPYAEYLADNGLIAITYDYRGIGDSLTGDLRKLPAVMTDWSLRDYPAVLARVRQDYSQLPVIIVGHSAGGWLLGPVAQHPGVRAVLTICTQSGHWRHWRGPRRVGMALLWHVLMPGLSTVMGYFPARRLGFGEDLPAGVAKEWARWGRNADYMLDEHGVPLRAGFHALNVPILSYSFADDWMAPRDAVEDIHRLFKHAQVERRHIAPAELGLEHIGHFGFFRTAHKEPLWSSSLEWMMDRLQRACEVTQTQRV
jgi:predicted alpha/beta hydrolase